MCNSVPFIFLDCADCINNTFTHLKTNLLYLIRVSCGICSIGCHGQFNYRQMQILQVGQKLKN